jgi:hypothetical protein
MRRAKIAAKRRRTRKKAGKRPRPAEDQTKSKSKRLKVNKDTMFKNDYLSIPYAIRDRKQTEESPGE